MWIDEPNSTGAPAPASDAAPAATETQAAPDAQAQAPNTGGEVQTPAVPDVTSQLATLATETGFTPEDLAGFTSVDAARAAIADYYRQQAASQFVADDTDATGAEPPIAEPTAKKAPVAVPVSQLDLKALGLEDDEPAAKAIRALESSLAASQLEVKAVAEVIKEIQAAETAREKFARQQRENEAEQIVDGFQSVTYGVAGKRTAFQKQALQRLYNVANGIAIMAFNQGRPIPPAKERLELARKLDDPVFKSQAAAPTSPPALPQKAVGPTANDNGLSFFKPWRDDPAMLNLVKAAG